MARWLTMAVSVAVAMSVLGCDRDSDDVSDVMCRERLDDQSGYLQNICQYIVDEIGSYSIDPNLLEVQTIESGSLFDEAYAPYDNSDYDWVSLNCCYTGDVAVMSVTTGLVVDFRLGAL